VLIVSFIAASFLAQSSADVRAFLLLALAVCAVLFLIILVGDFFRDAISPSPVVERTLWNTVSFSFTHPQFSNRSYAAPFYSAILIGGLWLIHRIRSQHNERNA
jgi:hypothetical protein